MAKFGGFKPGDMVRLKGDRHWNDLVISRLGRADYDGNQVEVAYWTDREDRTGQLVTKWVGADALVPVEDRP